MKVPLIGWISMEYEYLFSRKLSLEREFPFKSSLCRGFTIFIIDQCSGLLMYLVTRKAYSSKTLWSGLCPLWCLNNMPRFWSNCGYWWGIWIKAGFDCQTSRIAPSFRTVTLFGRCLYKLLMFWTGYLQEKELVNIQGPSLSPSLDLDTRSPQCLFVYVSKIFTGHAFILLVESRYLWAQARDNSFKHALLTDLLLPHRNGGRRPHMEEKQGYIPILSPHKLFFFSFMGPCTWLWSLWSRPVENCSACTELCLKQLCHLPDLKNMHLIVLLDLQTKILLFWRNFDTKSYPHQSFL